MNAEPFKNPGLEIQNELDMSTDYFLLLSSFEKNVKTHTKKSRKLSGEDHFSPLKDVKRKWSLMEFLNSNPGDLDISGELPLESASVQGQSLEVVFPHNAEDSSDDEDTFILDEKLKKAFNVDDFGFSKEDSLISLFEPDSQKNMSESCTRVTFVSGDKKSSKCEKGSDRKAKSKLSFNSPCFTLRQQDNFYDIKPDEAESDDRKTLIIKNVPVRYTRKAFLERINSKLAGLYDYLYLPLDPRTHNNLGYAFINLRETKDVKAVHNALHGKKWKSFKSNKVCEIKYARIQGRCEVP